MNQSGLIIPKGYINAFFDGYDNKDIRIRIVDEERLGSFYLTICDSNKRVFFLKNGHKDRIDLALLKDNSVEVGNYWIVVVYYSDGLERVSFLRNMSLSVPSEAKGKIYDKRRLYGEVKKYDKDILFLLCYETNQVLSLEVHNRLDTIYTNQLVGELIMTENEEEIDEETKKQLYVKIPRLDGYYVGLCNKNGEIIEYNDLEVYDRFAYMSFFVDLQEHKTLDGFSVVWKKDKIYYKVPLKFYKDDNYALISDAQYIDGILSFCVQYELNCEGLFSEAILRQQAEIWESKQDYIVNIDK